MIRKTFAIVALLAIGVTFAYAETSTVEVPFISHGQSCTFDPITIEYHCTWQGIRDTFTIEDLKEFKSVLSEETYNQEIQRLNEAALAEIAIEQAKLTPNEVIIQEIERKLNKGIATASDSVLMHLLQDLDTCQQGMDDRTVHIQTAREFEVSGFKNLVANNVKADGLLGKISLAIQECKAQKVVYAQSVGYANMETGEDDRQFSLADYYTYDVQAIPFDQYTRTTTEIDKSAICDNNQFADTQKVQFGCEVLYDGKTVAEIERENELRFGTDGMIGYQSEILDDYHGFLETYGGREATVEDKKIEELVAIPIANEWKEDSLFYQSNSED
tara:strand:+ start:216 stop:1205 length:990 start_codon:yes stop_codon:yes gene_type:complete